MFSYSPRHICAQNQYANEMSQIEQPLMSNMMENRRVRRRVVDPRTQALHEEPNWEGLDSKLRRSEKLANMRQEVRIIRNRIASSV